MEPPRQKGPMGAVEERRRVEVVTPTPVQFPEGTGPIVHVQVGGRHTIAADSSGRIWGFGDDRRVQLGLGDTRTSGADERHCYGVLNRDHLGGMKVKSEIKRTVSYLYYDPHMQASPVECVSPVVFNRPPYPFPTAFSCGEDFTVAIHRDSPDWYTSDQETSLVLCTGENGEGQCGRNMQQQQQTWLAARLPKKSRPVAVASGQGHALTLMSAGDVYAWGSNYQGQVATGRRAAVSTPVRVRYRCIGKKQTQRRWKLRARQKRLDWTATCGSGLPRRLQRRLSEDPGDGSPRLHAASGAAE